MFCRAANGLHTSKLRLVLCASFLMAAPALGGSIFDDDYVPPPTQGAQPSPDKSAETPKSEKPEPGPETVAPTPSPAPAAQGVKLPVPAADAQAQSRKLYKQLFSADLKDESRDGRAALSTKLLQEADKVTDNACDRFVLFVGACEAASESGNIGLLKKAADAEAASFAMDAPHLVSQVMVKKPMSAADDSQAMNIVDGGIDMANRLMEQDDFESASHLLSSLQSVANRFPDVSSDVKESLKRLSEFKSTRQSALTSEARLKTNPNDPAANAVVGGFTCFIQHDFDAGLPRLCLCNDVTLRNAAKRDVGNPTSANEQLVVADDWWMLADNKTTRNVFREGMRQRAIFWYEKAMSDGRLTGLRREIAETRIAAGASDWHIQYLPSLKETKATGMVVDGYWGLGKNSLHPGKDDKITVDGTAYSYGLALNPNSDTLCHVTYDLGGKVRRFSGSVAMNDSAGTFAATVTFIIVGDGKELWRSKPLRSTRVLQDFSVIVKNVRTLDLQVKCDGTGHNAHCVWVEPRVQ